MPLLLRSKSPAWYAVVSLASLRDMRADACGSFTEALGC